MAVRHLFSEIDLTAGAAQASVRPPYRPNANAAAAASLECGAWSLELIDCATSFLPRDGLIDTDSVQLCMIASARCA